MLTPAQRVIAASMPEADLLDNVLDACAKFGLDAFHVRDARGQRLTGLTDLVIVGDRWAGLFELKKQSGYPTPEQRRILARLGEGGVYRAGLWRPGDWLSGRVECELLGGRFPPDAADED